MSSLLYSSQMEDTKRLDVQRQLLLDMLNAQKALLMHAVRLTDQSITAIQAMQPATDFVEFAVSNQLLITQLPEPSSSSSAAAHAAPALNRAASSSSSSVAAAAAANPTPATPATPEPPRLVSVFDLPLPASSPAAGLDTHHLHQCLSMEAELRGHMQRPGSAHPRLQIRAHPSLCCSKILRSNWKDCYCVLSKSGFLHYFDSEQVCSVFLCLVFQRYDCSSHTY